MAYAVEGCGTTVTECRIKQKIEDLQRQVREQQAALSSLQQGHCLRNMTITEWADCVNKSLGEQQVKNQALKTKVDTQQQQMGEIAAENKKQQAENQALKTQVDTQQQQMGEIAAENKKQQAENKALKTKVDTQQQQMGELAAENKKRQTENKALKTQVEQLSQQLHTLPATTEDCTSAQTGQIRFDGTYARLCNGTHWQVMDARHPKPVLKATAKKYTMAEVRATAKENSYGQGTICETGYHLCIFLEALVLKYAYPRSRIPFEGQDYLRTLGNHSGAVLAGSTTAHNSLLGHKEGGSWNGPSLQCPNGSGPMLHFQNKHHRNLGYEWKATWLPTALWLCLVRHSPKR
ncbi:MAG: hypothetical protein B6247_16145 [Candidatus Parabeggiatoa sp. nov. 2]|nr:MAG: hypothetical protein B6247_16145 [Beggiatoa sp. 4572_84]